MWTPACASTRRAWLSFLNTVATSLRTTIGPDRPDLQAELPLGRYRKPRLQGLIPPLVEAPCIVIRKHAPQVISLERMVEQGVLSRYLADVLRHAVAEHWNVLVVGGPRTGKTTLANAILKEIAEQYPGERIVLIEDTIELQCESRDYLGLRVREGESMAEPPPELYSRLGAWFMQGADSKSLDWYQVLEQFQSSIQTLENALAGRLHPERLDSGALLTHLRACLTGLYHPIRPLRHGSYLNCVLGYPHESQPGMLDLLNSLGFAYRWSNRILPLGRESAEHEIKQIEHRWFQKPKGLGAWVRDILSSKRSQDWEEDDRGVDQHAVEMVSDAAAARAENSSGEVRFCYYTSTVVVMERDPRHADYIASEIVKALNEAGFATRVETVNALEAYLASLPGHGYPNIRRSLLASTNIADLLPTTSVWPGLPRTPRTTSRRRARRSCGRRPRAIRRFV